MLVLSVWFMAMRRSFKVFKQFLGCMEYESVFLDISFVNIRDYLQKKERNL